MKNKNLSNKNGITLIALIITIIVMLILVAVTISMAVNGGLFGYASNAARDTEFAKKGEQRIGTGQIEVDGSIYNSPEDYINGVEATPTYSASLLNTNGVLTKTAEYIDENDDTAIIPKGYGIVTGCEAVNQGLVISDEFDSNGNSVGNEFVWIPVPGKDMKVATISDPYVYDAGINYGEPKELVGTDVDFTSSLPGGPYKFDSQEELDYRYGANYFSYETDFAYEAHYKEMAESVNKYGGFYIGRYETTVDSSNNIGSKANTTVLVLCNKIFETTAWCRWWGLYYASRHADVAQNGSTVQTNMIWGQQWSKMIDYVRSKGISVAAISTSTYDRPSGVLASGQATYTNKTDSTDVIYDKIFNIYDLRANVMDWTAEGRGDQYRVVRGGDYQTMPSCSASQRDMNLYQPLSGSERTGSRLALCIL